MSQIDLAVLTDAELLQKAKKTKSSNLINAGFIGLIIGIAVYSIWNNGLNFFLFIHLALVAIAIRKGRTDKAVEKEVEEELRLRNLK